MNKNVLITGASRGIGREAAKVFAEHGCNLALCCHNSIDDLKLLCAKLSNQYNISASAFCADVSDSKQSLQLIDNATRALGSIDILINNAGISIVGLICDLSDEDWMKIVNTNLSSVFYCSRSVLPQMIRRKSGKIINVSSVFGIYGASCEAAYSATKGGVNALTRSMAKELAISNIQVNAAAFGAIDTSMNDNLSDEEKKSLSAEIPADRFATSMEAGEFLYHIASSPSYKNGQIIQFDGGWI